jgi:hypothetical protein
MKKIALLLAMLMSVSAFASCGDTEDDDDKKSSSSISSDDADEKKDKKDSDEDEEKSNEGDEESDKDNEDEKKSDEDDESSKKDEENQDDEKQDDGDNDDNKSDAANGTEFQRGTVDGDVYSSEYSNFQFTLPSEWNFMSDEEVIETMNIGLDITDANFTAELLQQTVIYDAVANNTDTGESIMVMYENISKTVPDPDSFTVEDYYDKAFENAERMMSGVTLSGGDEIEAVDIGGTEYLKYNMHISYDEYGVEVDQTYLGRKIDNFIFVITYSSGMGSGSLSDYMNCFDSLD